MSGVNPPKKPNCFLVLGSVIPYPDVTPCIIRCPGAFHVGAFPEPTAPSAPLVNPNLVARRANSAASVGSNLFT